MNLKLKRVLIENFKGVKSLSIDFGDKTSISGRNATGKTSIMDAFTWLLFNKDSQGKADFCIRPNDSDGNRIDNVVIKVSAVLDADGKEILVTKTQEQNWVKKRGSEVSQLQGNINKYEINEIPKTEKDYKSYIENLVSEELFKLITSPQAFTALKWKDQRAILLKLVSEVADQDVIETDEKFLPLAEMLADASVDDLTAKAKKALKELNKKQAELPARIDEASKGIVNVDFEEYGLQKLALEKQIRDLEEQENNASKSGEAMAKIQNEIMQRQFDLGELKRAANEKLIAQRREVQKRIDVAGDALTEAIFRQGGIERDIQTKTESLEGNRAFREALLKNHQELKSMQMDSNSCNCPMCGQVLPEDQKEIKIAEFQQNKQKSLDDIIKNGKQTAANIAALEEEIKLLHGELEACKSNKVEQNRLKTAAMKELEILPQEIDLSGNQEYLSLQEEIQLLEKQAQEMSSGAGYLNQIKQKKGGLMVELDWVKTTLAGKENNERVQARIAELQQEQRTVSQQIANQEKGLFLLEEFTKAKMDLLSTRINSKFKVVNFRLFENQINGGYKETCECVVNGVPFSSLNAGHKVVAGLDIISALQEIYEITAPIFIDNAESVNDFNIPEMAGQLILLKVSENNELKVEV